MLCGTGENGREELGASETKQEPDRLSLILYVVTILLNRRFTDNTNGPLDD